MSADGDLAALADLCGVVPAYHDLQGVERLATPDTQRALLAALGIDVSGDAAIREALAARRHAAQNRWFPREIIVESGVAAHLNFGLGARWELREDGQGAICAEGRPDDHIALPPLPSGLYDLIASASGRTETVIVIAAPARLPLVGEPGRAPRFWGLNCALYGLRSRRNSGLGDFADLAGIAEIAGGRGAAFVGVNPLHNMGFANLDAISPYSPSHRGFVNTAHIAPDAIPGLGGGSWGQAEFDAVRRAKTVQYRDHKRMHNRLLDSLHERFGERAEPRARAEFAAFRAAGGPDLDEFARFEALSETHGSDWRDWPGDIADPPGARAEFHIWLQWVADTQLATAQARARSGGMALGLYLDLAVGPRRDGGESWCARSVIAPHVSIGAPPDHLGPEGQNWNLAAFAPERLRAQRYLPLRRILARTMRHAGIIRIDHVLGLCRSFWVPDDGSPGGYVRQPFEALLAIIKIEAERHNCAVIGEDLGLVPEGFRETMRGHGFHGYSVLQYERGHDGALRDPGQGDTQVLSCFATHDTPTVRGFETSRDIDWWQSLNRIDASAARRMRTMRDRDVAGFRSEGDFKTAVHRRLAGSSAELVAIQLDDVLDATEAQNLPGTIDQHPNWRRKCDVALEDLAADGRLGEIGAIMDDAGRTTVEGRFTDEG